MSTFQLTIRCNNAAFGDVAEDNGNARSLEVARILRDVWRAVKEGETEGVVRDVNGNSVGLFEYHGR